MTLWYCIFFSLRVHLFIKCLRDNIYHRNWVTLYGWIQQIHPWLFYQKKKKKISCSSHLTYAIFRTLCWVYIDIGLTYIHQTQISGARHNYNFFKILLVFIMLKTSMIYLLNGEDLVFWYWSVNILKNI